MDKVGGQVAAEGQIAEAMAAEHESLSLECRADAARLGRLLAPDCEPISVENMRGWLLAEGLVMAKYTSENHGRRSNRTSLWRRIAPGHWQVFHHQGTITTR